MQVPWFVVSMSHDVPLMRLLFNMLPDRVLFDHAISFLEELLCSRGDVVDLTLIRKP